ncbi:MAG TPA: c-type cytochrome [Chitinophagales bacterium]|nr:c-type cytochrome [Chitinophagales bacterium]
MKTIGKVLKWTGIAFFGLIALLVVTVFIRYDRTFEEPYPDIHASTDSAVIARGKYLAYGPAHCAVCHTTAKDSLALENGEYVPMSGGRLFNMEIGKQYTANLTPDNETGIGNVPDSVLARTLRYGVNRHGHAIIPFMPYKDLSDMDLTALLSYLRSQPPVKNKVPAVEYNFMGKAVMAFLLKPEVPTTPPPYSVQMDTTAEYGKYLAYNMANCRGCHTNRDMKTGEFIGLDFAGGMKMPCDYNKNKVYCPPNLTTDAETSPIANWTYEQFRDRFKTGALIPGSHMPWTMFNRMNETDMKAVYKYLHSLPAIKNETGPYVQKAQG